LSLSHAVLRMLHDIEYRNSQPIDMVDGD